MSKTSQPINQLRIIGGKWRGRKLHFANMSGLRPTTDRVRETVFNWLAPIIYNARCLDLFAGSGALGFEALSRGAADVSFVDNQPKIINQLRQNAQKLAAESVEFFTISAIRFLETQQTLKEFDIIFLDPPFNTDLLEQCCELLASSNLLADDALIYIETEKKLEQVVLPKNWQVIKQKKAGQVNYCLLRI